MEPTNTKIIEVSVKPTKQVLKEFAETLRKVRKGQKVKRHVGISFESIDRLRNVLTRKRLEIISIVRHQKPRSIYELSKLLDRDLKSVNVDLKVLKENNFIEFKKINHGRQRVIPTVNFNDINIRVEV